MRFNILLLAAGFASTAIASSYNYASDNYARGVDSYDAELQEREIYDAHDEVLNFLRSVDEYDEDLANLYRRQKSLKKAAKKVVNAFKFGAHQAKHNGKGAISRVTPIKFKNQVKPVGNGPRMQIN